MRLRIFHAITTAALILSLCAGCGKPPAAQTEAGLSTPPPAPAATNPPAPTEEPPKNEIPANLVTDDNESKNMVWVIDPTLEYDDIRFLPGIGYIGYTAEYRMFFLDEISGEAIRETEPTGGFGHPHQYGYYADTMIFYYDEQYEFLPEKDETLYAKSQNAVLCIYELEPNEWGLDYKENGKYAIYYDGRFVSDFIYDDVIGGNGIAFVRQNDKYAFADANGNLLTDFAFESVSQIVGQYIAVQQGGAWGFVDLAGKEMIPFIYADAMNIDEKTAFAKYNGKYGILDVEASGAHR